MAAKKNEVTQMLFSELDNYGATQTGLTLPPDLPFETAQELGERLGKLNNASMFWVGDWMNYCEGTYKDRASQLMEVTGYSLSTLQKAASTCKAVSIENRREELTFSHHTKVQAMAPEQQVYWLDEAVKLVMPVDGLAAAIKDAQRMLGAPERKKGPGRPPGSKKVSTREAAAAVRGAAKRGRPRKDAEPADERDPAVVAAQEAQQSENGGSAPQVHIVDAIRAALLQLRKAGVELDKQAMKLETNLAAGDVPYADVADMVAALRVFDAAKEGFVAEVLTLRRMEAGAS